MNLLLLLAARPAAAVDQLGAYAFAYGDPHAHTGISHDGWSSDLGEGCVVEGDCGSFQGVFDTARAAGLDWVLLSDHINGDDNYSASDAEFLDLMALNLAHAADTDLLVVPGAEVWFTMNGSPLGHKNLFLFGEPAALADLSITDVRPTGTAMGELTQCSEITDWMDDLTARFGDALLVAHHPMSLLPMPTDWSCTGGTYEPAVEMFSAWGTGLGWDQDFELPEQIAPDGAVSVAMDPAGYALDLGFLGGTDSHNTLPGDLCQKVGGGRVSTGGLTIAVVPRSEGLSRTSLRNALVAHRTLVTSGPHLPFMPNWSDDHGNHWSLGERIDLPMGEALRAQVITGTDGAAAVQGVWLYTPTGKLAMTAVDATTWETTIPVDQVPAWVYVAVQMDGAALGLCEDYDLSDAEWEWSSPSWIDITDHDWDGDGDTFGEGDLDDENPAVGACDDPETLDAAHATAADTDGDGVSNVAEIAGGTDPCAFDTDADGLRDPDEATAKTDPHNPDTDGDGLLDGEDPEPLVADTGTVDSGETADTAPGESADTGTTDQHRCGCASASAPAPLLLLGALALRRRRRR